MNILREVFLDSSIRKKDGSVKLSFVTSLEQNTKEFCEIDEQRNQHGLLFFKPSGTLTQKEIDALDKTELTNEGKSKSQRLRSVLYLLSVQENKDSKEFYSDTMEKIIEHYKNKLDER